MSEVSPEVSVAELDQLCQDIADMRVKIAEEEAKITPLNKRLAEMEIKAAAYLDALGRDNFQSKAGTIYMNESWRFNLPKTDEDKKAFFDYLRAQGLYDKYATVNSTSYNSYLNTEWEVAKQEGRGMEFHIPGVPEPTLFRKAAFRKAKS